MPGARSGDDLAEQGAALNYGRGVIRRRQAIGDRSTRGRRAALLPRFIRERKLGKPVSSQATSVRTIIGKRDRLDRSSVARLKRTAPEVLADLKYAGRNARPCRAVLPALRKETAGGQEDKGHERQ